jgi:hypothetical protein
MLGNDKINHLYLAINKEKNTIQENNEYFDHITPQVRYMCL